jgi:Flp pilus assembly protein TadD
VELDGKKPYIRYALGILLERSGDLEEASSCFRLALEIKPDFADARSALNRVVARSTVVQPTPYS